MEKLNLPEDPDFYPLVRSVIELRERVKEHDIFTKWDIIQGLGRVNPGPTSQWLQTIPNWLWKSGSTTVIMCHHGSLNQAPSR